MHNPAQIQHSEPRGYGSFTRGHEYNLVLYGLYLNNHLDLNQAGHVLDKCTLEDGTDVALNRKTTIVVGVLCPKFFFFERFHNILNYH